MQYVRVYPNRWHRVHCTTVFRVKVILQELYVVTKPQVHKFFCTHQLALNRQKGVEVVFSLRVLIIADVLY